MGETVLSFAACLNHYRIVSYLINEVGVDPKSLTISATTSSTFSLGGAVTALTPRDIIRTRIVDDNGKHTIVTNEEEIWSTPPKSFSPRPPIRRHTLAEDEEEESDEKKSAKPHVSQMYYYLAKMKFEVRSQQEFNNLDEADRELYLDDLMLKADDSLANSEGLTPLLSLCRMGRWRWCRLYSSLELRLSGSLVLSGREALFVRG
ncbi:hypothetical protein BC829DRAFT_197037 [Chytridium lagenaria]|nr:hypothetical protein BC829DRAFT_197037 [Chytridium lagenaria]